MDKISTESFLEMEKLCKRSFYNYVDNNADATHNANLLNDVFIPKFDDTLEEIDFILKLGLKLKEEGKTTFPSPPPSVTKITRSQSCSSSQANNIQAIQLPIPQRRSSNIESSCNYGQESDYISCQSNSTLNVFTTAVDSLDLES